MTHKFQFGDLITYHHQYYYADGGNMEGVGIFIKQSSKYHCRVRWIKFPKDHDTYDGFHSTYIIEEIYPL